MVAKITGGGKGSSSGLVNYLEKQERGEWFSHDQAGLIAPQVTAGLDDNKKNLGQQDDKFYQVIFSPSQAELTHIGSDTAKLRNYTRDMMQQYAANFGKGIGSQDLVWFAKIERERTHNHNDRAVQQGDSWKGERKAGDQTHIHVLVSRTENLERYKAGKETGEIDRKNPLKLSPNTNHRETNKGAVKGGFDRSAFKEIAEQQFDRRFGYNRQLSETYRYANTMQKGSQEERQALRLETLNERLKQEVSIDRDTERQQTQQKDSLSL